MIKKYILLVGSEMQKRSFSQPASNPGGPLTDMNVENIMEKTAE